MDETFNDKAIILKREPYKEVDSRVFVYTLDRGKLELITRGTQRSGSKLVAHIEPLNLVDIMIISGRTKKYIGSAVARDCQTTIKSDYNKILWAGNAVAVFNTLVREDHPDADLFYLLQEFLAAMAKADNMEELFAGYFDLKLLALLGYRPELNNCLVCNQKIVSGKNHFVFSRGGLICDKCFIEVRAASLSTLVSDNCLKLMRQVLLVDFEALGHLIVNSEVAGEFKRISLAILNHNKG
ncbi:MAG: DNA repair protein RecO [Candidatus Falkowbacteria bacterium]